MFQPVDASPPAEPEPVTDCPAPEPEAAPASNGCEEAAPAAQEAEAAVPLAGIQSLLSNNIARNLAFGKAKLGNVGRNQVLAPPIKMTPTKPGQGQPTPAVVPVASSSMPKVQIVKSSDGKIQILGLLPGQQIVKMPGGRFQIFSNQLVSVEAGTVILTTQPQLKMASLQAVMQQQVLQQLQVIQQQPLPQQQLLSKPSPAADNQSPITTFKGQQAKGTKRPRDQED